LKKYGNPRRTELIEIQEVKEEELIPEEEVIVMFTHSGYIKRVPITVYKQQKRGGKGIIGTETKEEDFVEQIFSTSTHNNILFFTDKGRVFCLKAYEIPAGTRYSKGKAIVNLLKLKDEKINAAIPIKKFDEGYLLMATKRGLIKKTKLSEFSNIRKTGIIAVNLRENDRLVGVRLSSGNDEIFIATKNGLAARFNEKNVKAIGRNASGVRGIKLSKDDEVIGFEICREKYLLGITENGYGKRTDINEYRLINTL
jgi:DNA gyrase subunit A